MLKQRFRLGCALLICFLCTGCWDGLDVERRAIITLAGVDYIPGEDNQPPKIRYTAQIARPSALGGGDKPGPSGSSKNFYVEEGTGQSISGAMEQTQRNIPRRFFIGHRRILIVGDTLARHGVHSILDEVVRNSESRLRTYILVAHSSDAKDIVQLPYPIARLPSDALWEMERTGDAIKVDAANFAAMMLDERDPYAMGVKKTSDASGRETFELADTALFKDDKLVDWLVGPQAEGLAWLVGHLRASTVTVRIPGKDGTVNGRLTRIRTQIYPSVVHGRIQIVVNAKAIDDIYENGTSLDLSDAKSMLAIAHLVDEKVGSEITDTITVLKQNSVDPVGFGRLIHQHVPAVWDTLQPHWRHAWKTIPVRVHVDVKVQRSGKIGPPLFESLVKN